MNRSLGSGGATRTAASSAALYSSTCTPPAGNSFGRLKTSRPFTATESVCPATLTSMGRALFPASKRRATTAFHRAARGAPPYFAQCSTRLSSAVPKANDCEPRSRTGFPSSFDT